MIHFLAAMLALAAPAPAVVPGPPAAESVAITRIAAVGKLWGEVRYLHPYLAYRDIDWDAALLRAL